MEPTVAHSTLILITTILRTLEFSFLFFFIQNWMPFLFCFADEFGSQHKRLKAKHLEELNAYSALS